MYSCDSFCQIQVLCVPHLSFVFCLSPSRSVSVCLTGCLSVCQSKVEYHLPPPPAPPASLKQQLLYLSPPPPPHHHRHPSTLCHLPSDTDGPERIQTIKNDAGALLCKCHGSTPPSHPAPLLHTARPKNHSFSYILQHVKGK